MLEERRVMVECSELREVFEDEQCGETLRSRSCTPLGRRRQLPAAPVRFPTQELTASPPVALLGADTDDVPARAGLDDEELARLREQGSIRSEKEVGHERRLTPRAGRVPEHVQRFVDRVLRPLVETKWTSRGR